MVIYTLYHSELGQYEDVETGLYYNRFRYYNPESGLYISQDPIRLERNNPNFYAYVKAGETIKVKNTAATYTIQQHIKGFDVSFGVDPQTKTKLKDLAFRYSVKDAEVLIEGKIPCLYCM